MPPRGAASGRRPALEPDIAGRPARNANRTAYIRRRERRRQAILKRTPAIIRKALELAKMCRFAPKEPGSEPGERGSEPGERDSEPGERDSEPGEPSSDLRLLMFYSARDPKDPSRGYNAIVSSSEDHRDLMARFGLQLEHARISPFVSRDAFTRSANISHFERAGYPTFEFYGPAADPKGIPQTMNSFPVSSEIPETAEDRREEDDAVWKRHRAAKREWTHWTPEAKEAAARRAREVRRVRRVAADEPPPGWGPRVLGGYGSRDSSSDSSSDEDVGAPADSSEGDDFAPLIALAEAASFPRGLELELEPRPDPTATPEYVCTVARVVSRRAPASRTVAPAPPAAPARSAADRALALSAVLKALLPRSRV
jgi:hypothetical protein